MYISAGDWKLWVTSDEDLVHGNVTLVVYGDSGNSGPIVLGGEGQKHLFRKDNKDIFKVGWELSLSLSLSFSLLFSL